MAKPVDESSADRAVRLQLAALPYRVDKAGGLEVMLITSRTSRRWIIPKGWPIKSATEAETAAIEAFEEAGIRGTVSRRSIGTFRYDKFIDAENRAIPCDVKVFALRVKRQLKKWPEREQRDVRWLEPQHACSLVADQGLRSIIDAFAAGRRSKETSKKSIRPRA